MARHRSSQNPREGTRLEPTAQSAVPPPVGQPPPQAEAPAPPPQNPRFKRRYDSPEDQRDPFQKDRDRILYTYAFRRLAGVTQVVSPVEGHIFHNRLTHTLEVAQIARRLAENLLRNHADAAQNHGGLHPEVAESAALAHDLGHPPFGHVAEKELDRVVVRAGVPEGYEGNAQSFRIVTKLAGRGEGTADAPGLDLTRATLNACLKYPWSRQSHGKQYRKWGYYHTEQADFDFARMLSGATNSPCLEAQVMTWADDIGYSVHDTEDFFRAGLLPLDRIANSDDEVQRFLNYAFPSLGVGEAGAKYTEEELRTVFQEFRELLPSSRPYTGAQTDRNSLRAYTSSQIGRYLTSISILPQATEDGELLDMPRPLRLEIELVKQLTWYYVIDSAALAAQQRGQRMIIRTLFSTYYQAARNKDWRMLPAGYREEIRQAASDKTGDAHNNVVRLIADMVAEMTDQQALSLFHRLTGHLPGSVLDPILR